MNPEQMKALACAYRFIIGVMQKDLTAINAAITDGPEDSTGVAFAFSGIILDLAHRDAFEDGQLLEYLRSDLAAIRAEES